MQKHSKPKQIRKAQRQERPGSQEKMNPKPVVELNQPGGVKLKGKVALITGGDSGIGRSVAVLFAKEGASIIITYLSEDADARETKRLVEQYSDCMLVRGDLSIEAHCKNIIMQTVRKFGRIDILVNNAGIHWECDELEKISTRQLLKTFATNIFSFFWMTKYALKYIPKGGSIINTTSVTAYRGSDSLIDYASTKGAIVSFTRSLSSNLNKRGIRVNAVAPGPIWTPLIVSSFEPKKIAKFGSDAPMGRSGQPAEVAPCYLFLACEDSGYMTGQVLHPNGGEIVNG